MISTFRIDPVRDDHDLGVRPMIRPIRILGMAPLATIVAVLAACANPRADQAAYAQNALIGMPEEALLSCAGVPDRSRSAGGREYFTYQVEQIDSYAYPAYGGGFYRPWYGSRFGYRSEEHTSELQSLMRISYAVFF